jgi:hypothetical protein
MWVLAARIGHRPAVCLLEVMRISFFFCLSELLEHVYLGEMPRTFLWAHHHLLCCLACSSTLLLGHGCGGSLPTGDIAWSGLCAEGE